MGQKNKSIQTEFYISSSDKTSRIHGIHWMGTGEQLPIVLKTGHAFIKIAVKKVGRESFDPKLHKLILGGYNKEFEPGKTEHDWLSRDIEQAMRYEADPDCQFAFSNGAYEDFFQVMSDLSKEKQFENIKKTLPILLVSGASDPVGQFGKGVKRVYKRLLKRELSDVTLKLYPQARHELLNEINYQEVFRDIRSWLDGHIR